MEGRNERKKRHLELAVVKSELDQVTFRIADQTHFGKDFCQKGKVFKAKNGIPITSLSKTIIAGISPKNGEYKCRIDKFILVMESVAEYNETNGDGYEKKIPEEGDNFYFITSKMTVSLGEFGISQDGYEFEMRDAGNCFLTREEAEAALERVKKALKGE